MATLRQRKAVKKIVENRGVVSKAMIESGYAPNSAKNPINLTASKGFIEVLDELGLTDEFLTTALVEDIAKKKGNRKGELELGFKVRGRLKEAGNGPIVNNLLVISDEQITRIASRINRGEVVDGSEPSTEELDRLPDSNEPEVRAELASRTGSEGA